MPRYAYPEIYDNQQAVCLQSAGVFFAFKNPFAQHEKCNKINTYIINAVGFALHFV